MSLSKTAQAPCNRLRRAAVRLTCALGLCVAKVIDVKSAIPEQLR